MRLTTRMRQKHDMTTTDMKCTQTTLIIINRELQQFVNNIHAQTVRKRHREPQQFVTHVRTRLRDEQRPHRLRGTSCIYSPTFMSTSYFSRARLLPYTCIFLAHSSGPHKCIILARGSGIRTIRSCRNESIFISFDCGRRSFEFDCT
jgi:hypothetical protein